MDDADKMKEKWERTPADHYFARLAFMLHLLIRTVASIFTKLDKDETKESDFLVEFVKKVINESKAIAKIEETVEDESTKPVEERSWYKRAKESERAWCMILGVDQKEMDKPL